MDSAAAFWDRLADRYAARPFPDPSATARKVAASLAVFPPRPRLLDVGCASGALTLELAAGAAEVVAVDHSPRMIELAERRAATAGATNVRFTVASGLADQPDASFDGVALFNVLHLVPEPGRLLADAFRVLRPGGGIATSTVCLGGRWFPPYPLLLPVARWIGVAPAVTFLTAEELRAHFAAAGFTDITAPEVGNLGVSVFLTARKPA